MLWIVSEAPYKFNRASEDDIERAIDTISKQAAPGQKHYHGGKRGK